MGVWSGSKTAVAVTSAAVATIDTITIPEGANRMWAEIGNVGSSAFYAFQVQYRPHVDASHTTIASTTAEFTTAIEEPIKGCSTDLTTLASAATGLLWLDVKGIESVRFRAQAATNSDATANLDWSVR